MKSTCRIAYGSIVLGLMLAGCPGGFDRLPQKDPTSALWVGTEAPPVTPELVSELRAAGIGEIWIPVARLDFEEDGGPLVRAALPEIPAGTPVTLVIAGADLGSPPESGAKAVAEAAHQIRFDVEARGLVPVGVHLDLAEVPSQERYAEFLRALRGELDRTLYLSATLPREGLGSPETEKVAAAVDFVVPAIYGQRPRESEDPEAWDFAKTRQQLEVLDSYGVPYMPVIVTVGTITHLGGGVGERSTHRSMADLLWNRSIKLKPGFSLEGMNRRVYTFVADDPSTLGDWKIQRGDSLRVVRVATTDLRELLRLVREEPHPKLFGQLYFRQPAEDEKVSLTAANVLNAIAEREVAPELAFSASPERRFSQGWIFRFGITNLNGEISELALLDNNYLEIALDEGRFGSTVDTGDFYRYELFLRDRDGQLQRQFRDADVLRLHAPILDGGLSLTSGDVRIYGRRASFKVASRFLLPDGRTIDSKVYEWRDGELRELPDEPAP